METMYEHQTMHDTQAGIMDDAAHSANHGCTGKSRSAEQGGKYGMLVNVISTLLIVLAGVAVSMGTGLYDGVVSPAEKIGLVTVISYCYLSVFRRALHSR